MLWGFWGREEGLESNEVFVGGDLEDGKGGKVEGGVLALPMVWGSG